MQGRTPLRYILGVVLILIIGVLATYTSTVVIYIALNPNGGVEARESLRTSIEAKIQSDENQEILHRLKLRMDGAISTQTEMWESIEMWLTGETGEIPEEER